MTGFPPTADCIYITGPTASGKSTVGVELAKLVEGEIISLDSMAVYRGMDVGTAKPGPKERGGVEHHLIDILDPTEDFSVAQYVAAAEEKVRQLRERGCEPLFVGGTPLYLKALLRGIFEGPEADWAWRRELTAESARHDPGWLHARLAAVDAPSAERLHPNDTRRLVRALEVHHKTGRPMSHWQQQFDRGRPAEECAVFWLDWPPEVLAERINRRVDAMFAEGLVAEVEALTREGKTLSHTASQALGYREVLAHLACECELPETIELVKTHTRQFAKRQRTWFRSLSECQRVEMTAGESAAAVAARLAELLGGRDV